MRLLATLLILLTACRAQSPEDQVAETLKKLERAEQTGNADALLALWTHEKLADVEKMRPYIRPQPDRQYRASKIYVQDDQAVLLAQAAANSFVNMTLRKEDGRWKISDQMWRDSAADPGSVYALLPPPDGAFTRAGSHWDQVAPGMDSTRAASLGWQMRAVFDESFLYIRIESGAPLPPPGSTIESSPTRWPVMKIAVAGAGDFVLLDAVNIGDQATFDKNGRANSHRPFASYSMRLEHHDREVFSTSADLNPSRLIEVTGPYFDMRIPLRSLGITDSRAAKITVGDAQWPKSVFVSVQVPRYPR